MNGQALDHAYLRLPGGSEAISGSGGLSQYRQADWLGSARLGSSTSGAAVQASAYAPDGEAYQTWGGGLSFTGQNQDTVWNGTAALYDFPARRYAPTQGRWISPDPAGLAAVDPNDPQTWNRYAYVRNSPLALTDPLGLILCKSADGTLWNAATGGGGARQQPSLLGCAARKAQKWSMASFFGGGTMA